MLEEHVGSDAKVAGLLLKVKVVPGSSKDQIAGRLGNRLKIKVAAAPEKGKANQAVLSLLAAALGVSERNLTITAGQSSPEKTVLIRGCDRETLIKTLALDCK